MVQRALMPGFLLSPARIEAAVQMGYEQIMRATRDETVRGAIQRERYGGACPLCGVMYEAVRSEYVAHWGKPNQEVLGGFTYYRPACTCYQTCQRVKYPHGTVEGCGRILVAERLLGIDHCTSCAPPPEAKPVRRKASPGRKVAVEDGKAAAAGEDT